MPGLARIVVDDTLPVDFELDEANERLLVYSVIGILPSGPAREQFFEELLAANLFGAQTGQCSPAFDRERNEMLLWFALGEDAHIDGGDRSAREPRRAGAALAGSPQRFPCRRPAGRRGIARLCRARRIRTRVTQEDSQAVAGRGAGPSAPPDQEDAILQGDERTLVLLLALHPRATRARPRRRKRSTRPSSPWLPTIPRPRRAWRGRGSRWARRRGRSPYSMQSPDPVSRASVVQLLRARVR